MPDCSLTGSIFRFTRSLAILQHQPAHPTEISFLLKSKPINVSSYHTGNYTLNPNQGLCMTLHCYKVQFNSIQSLSHVQALRPHGLLHARLPCPSPTPGTCSNSCPSSRWCHPNISSCCPLLLLPSVFPSIRGFSNELVLCIRWPKYWSFSFSISPSNEYSGFISFRIDWFDLLAVQGIFKSFIQHHISKASILRSSAFFIVQLSHLYMTTGKNKVCLDGPLLAK